MWQAADDADDHVYEIDDDDAFADDDATFVGHGLATSPCSPESPLQLKLLILCSPTVQ